MRKSSLALLMLVGMFAVASPSSAMWAIRPDNVPVERLVANAKKQIAAKPDDAQGYYVLGRLHSMAFARDADSLQVSGPLRQPRPALPPGAGTEQPKAEPKPDKPIQFLPWESVKPRRTAKEISPKMLVHLEASIRNYAKAVKLDPKNPKALLGLAWMYEEAAKEQKPIGELVAGGLDKLPEAEQGAVKEFARGADQWREKAIAAYRQAYELTAPSDAKKRFLGPGSDLLISVDAGSALERLLGEDDDDAVKAELAKIKKHIASLQRLPRAVTPIVFSLAKAAPLEALLQADTTVAFDLDGDGIARQWPWVKAETSILVWDPKRTGRIEDGRQLFGSVTWWIFWNHGYEPLAALDNDRDGWLTGDELAGLAVWRDRNTNGRSEAGEVTPLAQLPVRRISVRSTTDQNGQRMNTHGLQLDDGRRLPTYDWTPTSVGE
jgi:tetratricopeptide (TPR) repeat protein